MKKLRVCLLTLMWILSTSNTVFAAPIKSQLNNKCIDVPYGNMAEGIELIMWDCNNGKGQQFDLLANGELRIGGYCVDAFGGGGNQGDKIGLWSCHGGQNQKWRKENGLIKGINNRCIDIASGNTSNGAKLLLWDCSGSSNQIWMMASQAVNQNVARYTPDPEPGKTEQCFGAVGNGCEGGGVIVPPARNTGGVRSQWVNVGSIAHDNCCRVTPNGQHCNGLNVRQEGWGDQYACVKEWRKAVYNWRDQRSWPENFGPYQSEYAGDDLKEVSARKMSLFNASGEYVGGFSGSETVSTKKLKAPSGTALDWGDEQFCASGEFRGKRSAPLGGFYGICH